MPLDEPLPVISARFHANASTLGFRAPPVALRVKLILGESATSLYVQPGEPCAPGTLVDWLADAGPLRVAFGERGVLRADFAALPKPWRWAKGVDVDMVAIDAAGNASVAVRGTRSAVTAMVRSLREGATYGVDRVASTSSERPLLTAAQDAALRAAWRGGYYQIPRPLNLKRLARDVGTSSASLSELLRRAEGRVVGRYLSDGPVAPASQDEAPVRPVAWPDAE